jgi:hypothetical protein
MRDGKVEAIRAIRVARSSAVKARTQATNQFQLAAFLAKQIHGWSF